MDKLTIGLIGCGPMGSALARFCSSVERAQVVAVADIDPAAAEKLGNELGVKTYNDDGRAILRRKDIAAVMIATPPHAHRKGVERAARAGKQIFCEKPMSSNVSDCDAMIAAVAKAGVKLQMGQVLRYLPLQDRTIQLARSGKYGTPFAMSVTRISGPGYGEWSRPWRDSHPGSGGVLLEINSHELDFMRQIFGDAATVFARGGRYRESGLHTPDQLFVTVSFEGGEMGFLHASVAAGIGEYAWKVLCTDGAIYSCTTAGTPTGLQHGGFGHELVTETPEELDAGSGYIRELREWVEAVLDDKPVTIPGIDSRKAVELAEGAYRSVETGKPVTLPLARKTGAMNHEWYESGCIVSDRN